MADSMATQTNGAQLAIETEELNLWYGDFQALFDVDVQVKAGMITSLIGPSGCGKTTLLRTCNRIIDRLGYVRTTGEVRVLGHDIFADGVELVQVRKQIGMVFQRPNPLPISIRDNVLFGFRLHEARNRSVSRAEEDEVVESGLSLEEQQKLCIARLLPVKPTVLLMDEPCSALDPAGTEAVEELIWTLRGDYTILIVTHNMAQARRASEECVFMLLGKIIEHGITEEMFLSPEKQETADYIEGRYG